MPRIYRICFVLFVTVLLSMTLGCSGPEDTSCATNGDCLDGQRCVKRVCKKVAPAKPVAQINAPTKAQAKTTIVLDGTGSSASDGGALTYKWKIVTSPPGSQVDLQNDTAAKASLVVDLSGDYIVELVVTNKEDVASEPARATIQVTGKENNRAPIADAGPDAFGGVGQRLEMDGTGSSDPDGDPLTYQWTFTAKPEGSQADFSDAKAAKPSITFDKVGKYVLQLVVNDGVESSEPDRVSVDVLDDFNLEPSLEKLNPASGAVDTTQQVTITGKGFSARASVRFDGVAIAAGAVQVKSQTEIVATFDLKGKTAKDYGVTVRNPNGKESQPLTFQVINPPTPTLTSIDPPTGLSGAKYTLRLTGTGFIKASEVLFNLVPLPTTYVSETALEASLDLSQTIEGDYTVKVRNPGGRSSAEVTFKVLTDAGFAPVLRVLNPPQGTVGTKIPFSVHGSSFSAGSVIIFNGKEIPSIRQSRDTIESDPELDLTNVPVGKYPVWVRSPSGKESNKETFEVIEKDPAPLLDRILPPTFYLNDVTKLDVYGKYFDPKVKLFIGTQEYSGSALSSVSTSYFSVSVDTKQGNWKEGSIQAYVINPNGKKSQPFTLTIAKKPTVPGPYIKRVNPTSEESGKTISNFYIYAENFCTGSFSCNKLPKVYFLDANGVDYQAKHNIYTSIKAYVSSSSPYLRGQLNLTSVPAGTYKIQLEHPDTQAKSNTENFTVKPPPGIRIDRLSPTSGDVGVNISDFRIYADYFCPGSTKCSTLPKIYIKDSNGTDLQAKHSVFSVTSTSLSGSSPYIRGSLNVTNMPLGTYSFQIEHPTSGKKSNTVSFTMNKPLPLSLSYVFPYYAQSGSVVKCDVNGGPFTSSTYVMVGSDKISLLSGTSTTRRSFNFDAKGKYSQVGNYDIRICNSPTQCSNVFAYPVQPSTGTTPFISTVKGQTFPLYTNTTVTLYIYGYRWPNAKNAQFFLDGKELNTTNFTYGTRTCKDASSPTSSSNCVFNQFSTKNLTVGKHTMQYKYNNTTSITYDFYVEKP